MTPTLERRLKFVERRGDRRKDLPWLRHKVLLVQLWTGAYMLDRWEGWLILILPVALVGAALYGWGYAFAR